MVSHVEAVPIGFEMTELGPLPADWSLKNLGNLDTEEILTFQNGFPCGVHNQKGEGIPHLRPMNVDSQGHIDLQTVKFIPLREKLDKYFLQENDVIFNNTNSEELVGKTAYWGRSGNYVLSNHMTRIRIIDSRELNPVFLAYFLHKRWYDGYYASICRRHVNQASISLERLKQISLPIPPLSEQRDISHVLSTIQRAIEAQDKVISAARELKKSLMRHLFTYGPIPVSEVDQVPLKETEIGAMPESWKVAHLGDVVKDKITDGVHKTPSYVEFGVPFITAKDIVNNRIDFTNSRNIPMSEHLVLTKRFKPEKGDILLTKVGTVGNVALVDTEDPFSIFVQLALIKPDNAQVDSICLKYVLLSESLQEEIVKKSAQSTMKFIGTQKIAQIDIPLPTLVEQHEIAMILTAIDNKIQSEENRKASLQTLFKTMLHLLMTGQLRVNNLKVDD